MTYRTAEAFRAALEHRLADRAGRTGLPLDRVRKYAAFERFLARVERVAPAGWVLKGGLAINCRLGRYQRPSRDLDLAHADEQAGVLAQLVTSARTTTDPDDHFRFRLSIVSAGMRGADVGAKLRLETRVGDRLYDLATIDVVAEADLFEQAELLEVPSLLDFAGLAPVTMLVTPVTRHLADKVDAYLRGRINRRAVSTREKDLADIVLLAGSERPRAGDLRGALARVLRSDGAAPAALPPPPAGWGAEYATLAAQLGLAERPVAGAFERARALIDPVLGYAAADDARWDPVSHSWVVPGARVS